jgi:hypothetical protein
MTVAADMQTVMEADTGVGGVDTLLTGGVYVQNDVNRVGINRQSAPDAFDSSTKRLKPCALINMRARVADGGMVDDDLQDTSWRQVIEIYLYSSGDASAATLHTVADRLYVLFHGTRVNNRPCHYLQTLVDQRDEPLQAHLVRVDFALRGIY